MAHLYNIYGDITEAEVGENEKRMNAEYDTEEEIGVLYYQIEDAVEYTDNASHPHTPA